MLIVPCSTSSMVAVVGTKPNVRNVACRRREFVLSVEVQLGGIISLEVVLSLGFEISLYEELHICEAGLDQGRAFQLAGVGVPSRVGAPLLRNMCSSSIPGGAAGVEVRVELQAALGKARARRSRQQHDVRAGGWLPGDQHGRQGGMLAGASVQVTLSRAGAGLSGAGLAAWPPRRSARAARAARRAGRVRDGGLARGERDREAGRGEDDLARRGGGHRWHRARGGQSQARRGQAGRPGGWWSPATRRWSRSGLPMR